MLYRISHLLSGMAILIATACFTPRAQAQSQIDADPIRYSQSASHDPVAQLQERLDRGDVKLEFTTAHGYLESALKLLKVPASSQGLVFSRTSFQRTHITPGNPRAVYFNDDTYIGYVRSGASLEVAAMDPQLGAVFYILKQEPAEKPRFVRQTFDCLQCHLSENTQNVPGLLMRSVHPDADGDPIQSAGGFSTNDHSPLAERWGGWYVTGKTGAQRHMGNQTYSENPEPPDPANPADPGDITNLAKRINTARYVRPTSDVVALMVLGHQQHVHNLLTSTNYYVRRTIQEDREARKGKESEALSETAHQRIGLACEMLVKALLFSGEAPLSEPIASSSGFAEEFAAGGPRDHLGRSLRDLDLTHRLFKYPCSYLIYSSQFDALPAEAKDTIYRRLFEILTGKDEGKAYGHLTADDRRAIVEILRETKKDLPGYWKMGSQ